MDANPRSTGALQGGAPFEQNDWRTQLRPDLRELIVNDILETLKRALPYSGADGLQELKRIAVRFEQKIFTAASSQPDYLQRLSNKMLTMRNTSQNTPPNAMFADASSINNRLPDTPATQNSGLVQPSLMQSASMTGLQLDQPLNQHSASPVLQQQSVTRQQQDVFTHLQQSQTMRQQPLMGQLANVADTQQIQSTGQQNSDSDILQDRRRMIQHRFQILQQLHQRQQLQHQQQLQQQQQLVAQNILVLQQQQQVLGSQFGNSGLPTNQHSVHMLQQPQVPTQQQPQPGGTGS